MLMEQASLWKRGQQAGLAVGMKMGMGEGKERDIEICTVSRRGGGGHLRQDLGCKPGWNNAVLTFCF